MRSDIVESSRIFLPLFSIFRALTSLPILRLAGYKKFIFFSIEYTYQSDQVLVSFQTDLSIVNCVGPGNCGTGHKKEDNIRIE